MITATASPSIFLLAPKVSAALWEWTRGAKLRCGGGRERLGTAIGVGVPKALR